MRISLFPIIGILSIFTSCNASKSGIFSKDEGKKITSFILVKRLPIVINTKDSTLGISLQKFMTDTLKVRGYKFISEEERATIEKKFFTDLFKSGDAASIQKLKDRSKGEKNYYMEKMERAAPLEQWISLSSADSNGNRINVIRSNFPAMKKRRQWLVPYEDSELVTTIASRIVDSLTARHSQ